jgi:lysophospholipase L1-like esterase
MSKALILANLSKESVLNIGTNGSGGFGKKQEIPLGSVTGLALVNAGAGYTDGVYLNAKLISFSDSLVTPIVYYTWDFRNAATDPSIDAASNTSLLADITVTGGVITAFTIKQGGERFAVGDRVYFNPERWQQGYNADGTGVEITLSTTVTAATTAVFQVTTISTLPANFEFVGSAYVNGWLSVGHNKPSAPIDVRMPRISGAATALRLAALSPTSTVGNAVRISMESTYATSAGVANGGKVYLDAIRSNSNMDFAISLNNISGAAPTEKLRLFGSGLLSVPYAIRSASLRNLTETKQALLAPISAHSKKIVVYGSSVAYGTGATNNQGWAFKLGQALISRGWTFVNKSIGGNNTTNLIDRFYTDLVPENPDVVVIGLSLLNEGLASQSTETGMDNVMNGFVTNMFKLIDMCRQQNFKVVVMGPYAGNWVTSIYYKYLKQLNMTLEESDVPFINLLYTVDDGTGKFRAGMYADDAHPNDIGHETMYRAIPLSMFDRLGNSMTKRDIFPRTSSYIQFDAPGNADSYTGYPLYFAPETAYGSYTIMGRFRRMEGSVGGVAVISTNNLANTVAGGVRVRAPQDYFDLAIEGTPNVAGGPTYGPLSSDNLTHHVAYTFDYYTNTYSLFVDGVKMTNSTAVAGNITPPAFVFMSRLYDNGVGGYAKGWEVSDIACYRVAYDEETINQAYRGDYPKGSLDLFAPCNDADLTNTTQLINTAPTSSKLKIGLDRFTKAVEINRFKGIEVGYNGIKFSPTQVSNTGPNTLDDYEEGTFSPLLYNSGRTRTIQTYNARYVKVGKKVTCWCSFDGGYSGDGVGNLVINGLPFVYENPNNWQNFGSWNGSGSTPNGAVVGIAGSSEVYIWSGGGYVTEVKTFLTCSFTYTVAT